MASTSYQNNIRSTTISGFQFGFDARTEWSSISRTNNRITINGLRTRMRVNSSSYGSYFSGTTVEVHTDVPNGTRRRNSSLGSGTFNRGSGYLGSAGNYSLDVGATATSVSSRSGVSVNGGTGWTGSQSITIPGLGVPSGNTAIASQGTTTIGVRNDTTSWGSNATAGSVRSYRADNSGFSGQTYINTSDNALVNHTGLTSNKRYWFRGWSSNGGGRSAYHGVTSTYTLPLAPVAGTPVIEATSATIPTTQNNGGGAYTITNQVRWREAGGTWGSWVTYTGGQAILTDLIPSVEYEYQLQSVTSAGTTTGSARSLSTLPAGKLIYPDGSVVNAIPRAVYPDGTVKMVNISQVRGE